MNLSLLSLDKVTYVIFIIRRRCNLLRRKTFRDILKKTSHHMSGGVRPATYTLLINCSTSFHHLSLLQQSCGCVIKETHRTGARCHPLKGSGPRYSNLWTTLASTFYLLPAGTGRSRARLLQNVCMMKCLFPGSNMKKSAVFWMHHLTVTFYYTWGFSPAEVFKDATHPFIYRLYILLHASLLLCSSAADHGWNGFLKGSNCLI